MVIPKWIAVAVIPLEFVLALVLAPTTISLLSARHGWIGGWPGPWNLLGLLPIAAGAAGIMWAVGLHVVEMDTQVEIESTPKYLLKVGPYNFSRNPIYVAVLTMWLGWTLLYGSPADGVVLVLLAAIVTIVVVPFEERRLERRFGDAYLQYKSAVPRWISLRGSGYTCDASST